MWINFASATGGLIFGRKVKGNTNNTFELTFASIKSCAYKTKYTAYAVGDTMELKFRIEFGPGRYKFYIEDCLLGVYGDADYTGETLYGKVLDDTTVASAGVGVGLSTFQSYMAAPDGLGVGFILWQSLDPVGGEVRFENIRYGALAQTASEPTVPTDGAAQPLTYIDSKEKQA